jgi:SAM-dependent methyltransferase
MIRSTKNNRFQDFFQEETYVLLKNRLYNYRLRKRAVEQAVQPMRQRLVLEVGSGLSPVATSSERVVYTELSPLAMRTLKAMHRKGMYVVADATRLPFRDGAFSHAVCSEVLEHLPDDQTAIDEMARVVEQGGGVTITVPHRRFYWANDDRYVHHFRRYEPGDLEEKLASAGASVENQRGVVGFLERPTMMTVIFLVERVFGGGAEAGEGSSGPRRLPPWSYRAIRMLAPLFGAANAAYAAALWLEARLVPTALASCILVQARKGRCRHD